MRLSFEEFFKGGTPLLYQGQPPKSTIPGGYERGPVTAVTEWEFNSKKNLISPGTGLN
jgi:hypothetical protein